MPAEMYVPAFYLKQRFAMTANRFEVVVANPDGSEGASLAWAQQKRLAFKEQVTFYADQARTQPVFGFRARQVVDLGAGYDVVDGAGRPLGYFKKDFGASLLRSTFHVEGPGLRGTGTERSEESLGELFPDVCVHRIDRDSTRRKDAFETTSPVAELMDMGRSLEQIVVARPIRAQAEAWGQNEGAEADFVATIHHGVSAR